MSDAELQLVVTEAKRVIADIKAVQVNRATVAAQERHAKQEGERFYGWPDQTLTAALRRHSMDLTKALARLRAT